MQGLWNDISHTKQMSTPRDATKSSGVTKYDKLGNVGWIKSIIKATSILGIWGSHNYDPWYEIKDLDTSNI